MFYKKFASIFSCITLIFCLSTLNAQALDSDGDGYNDAREIAQGTDPNDPGSFMGIPDVEREALIDYYNTTNGDAWHDNSGWKEPPLYVDGFAMPGTEPSWYGVACLSERVGIIVIGDGTTDNPYVGFEDTVERIWSYVNNLRGTIPSSLENLTNLNYLIMNGNQLTGSIPPELGNLRNLGTLGLRSNQLTGPIPPELGSLSQLKELYLSQNQLSSVPPELGNLTSLTSLELNHNQLTSIPPELGNLTNLNILYLDENQISGHIPPELGNLTNLVRLDLYENQLSGPIPSELGNLENLRELRLGNNQLNGPIPSQLGNLSNLTHLILYGNQLSGPIPSELGNLENLRELRLGNNQLNGPIPTQLGNLSNLTHLILYGNQLSGPIPASLGNLTNLTTLWLSNNQLSGPIPAGLGNLTNLTTLWLNINQLSGTVPSELGNLTKLTYLWLNNNQISDINALARLTSLQWLDMDSNQISDLQPLLDNPGLGQGDTVAVQNNPLSYGAIHTQIPILASRIRTLRFTNRTPTILTTVSGNNQSGEVLTILPEALVVEVRDEKKALFEGVPVTFTVVAGGGSLSAIETTTDANGLAESILTLGPTAGANTVEVTAADIATPVVFNAIATGNSPPTVDAGGPYSVDEGGSIPVSATGNDPGSEPGTLAYAWDLDGNGTFETPGQTVTFSATSLDGPDTITITAQVTDTGGLTATDEATINVLNVAPTVGVTNDGPKPESTTVTVTVSQTDPGISDTFTYSFDWDNDGSYDIVDQASPSANNIWDDDGTYTVSVQVKDDDGGVGTATTEVTVTDLAPTASFIWSPEPQDEGAPIQFTDTSISSPDAIVSWSWVFDDGNTSNVQNPSYTYMDNGNYTVTLMVTDDDGSTNTVSHNVNVANLAPQASFTWLPEPQHEGSPVQFTDNSASYPDTIVGWQWHLGDENTANEQNPSHIYADNGTYTVTLTVTDDDGSIDTVSHDVTINNVAPVVEAGANQTVNEGNTVFFSSGFTDQGSADTHTIEWNFGDGNTANGTLTPTHVYTDDGIYAVTLTVTDDEGGVGTDNLTVVINNVAPTVDADPDAVIDEGSTFTSSGSFTDPGTDSWTATIDYGDGTGVQMLTLTGNNFSLSHVYADNGAYTVTVTVTDDDGGVGSNTAIVTVNNIAPTVGAGPDAEINKGSAFSSSGSFSDPGADTWTATVNYGDGSGVQNLPLTGKNFNLNHVYADNGTHAVTVTVTDDDGGKGSDTATVTVLPSATIEVRSALHIVGTGNKPVTTKEPLELALKVFDKVVIGSPEPKNFGSIYESPNGLVSTVSISGPTQVSHGGGWVNRYIILVPSSSSGVGSGSYLVIGKATVGTTTVYVGSPTDALATNSLTQKYLQVIQNGAGKTLSAKTTAVPGSLLLIVEPEYLEFTSYQELLPIVYESIEGVWSVTVQVAPPEGFVSNPGALSTDISDNMLQTLQFMIEDVGSEWTFTGLTHKIKHKGKDKVEESAVAMVNQKEGKDKDKTKAAPTFIPAQFALGQNIPNPFNPETWLVYSLAKDVHVELKIYNVSGLLIRTLDLGQKAAGFYTSKDRAAHWDGRNEYGERVSSGIYFYTIQAGEFTATRKMLLLK